MPRVLITGAAGFIGMHAALKFIQEGWNVIGIDNMNDYYSVQLKKDRLTVIGDTVKLAKAEFIFFESDINSDVWRELDSIEIDVVLHLAAQAGVRYSIENPRAYLESNILGFQSVLEFVKNKSVHTFLYASSSSVYGKTSSQPFNENEPCANPESYYAATKKANELMAYAYSQTHNISSIGLRFFTVYGPWGRPDMAPMLFAEAARKGSSIDVFNYGNQSRDFTYIDDIVNGIFSLSIIENIKSAIVCNIGCGKPVKLMDFIKILEAQFDTKMTKNLKEAQNGDVAHTYADTRLLMELTGYSPKISIEEGIKKLASWYTQYYK